MCVCYSRKGLLVFVVLLSYFYFSSFNFLRLCILIYYCIFGFGSVWILFHFCFGLVYIWVGSYLLFSIFFLFITFLLHFWEIYKKSKLILHSLCSKYLKTFSNTLKNKYKFSKKIALDLFLNLNTSGISNRPDVWMI